MNPASRTALRRMAHDVTESLRSQPGRVGLSFLAVMIGIVVLTLLLAILFGLQRESHELVRRFGANVVALSPDAGVLANRGYRGADAFTDLLCGGMDGAACGFIAKVSDRTTEWPGVELWAAGPELPAVRDWALVDGRPIDVADAETGARVMLVTDAAARQYGIRVGSECSFARTSFRVIGIIADGAGIATGGAGGGMAMGIIPLSVAARMNLPFEAASAAAFLRVAPGRDVAAEARRAGRLFDDPALSDWNPSVVTADTLIRGIRDLQRLIGLTAGSVALLCLALGGTTLMSLMLADVRQRIPEIGLRRALGASRREVALLFVAESLAITGAAAAAGLLIGALILGALAGRSGLPVSLQSFTFVIPAIVSMVLGGVFSFWPARVAAGLSPAQALRNA